MPNYGRPFAGLCVATALVICGLTGYPVAPDVLAQATGTLNLEDGGSFMAVPSGSTFDVVGDGFGPGAAVTISVYSEPSLLAEVVADDAGTIRKVVQLPDGLAEGTHTVSAIGNSPDGDLWALQSEIVVVEADTLPFTGFSLVGLTGAGILLVIVGFALIRSTVFGRRFLPR